MSNEDACWEEGFTAVAKGSEWNMSKALEEESFVEGGAELSNMSNEAFFWVGLMMGCTAGAGGAGEGKGGGESMAGLDWLWDEEELRGTELGVVDGGCVEWWSGKGSANGSANGSSWADAAEAGGKGGARGSDGRGTGTRVVELVVVNGAANGSDDDFDSVDAGKKSDWKGTANGSVVGWLGLEKKGSKEEVDPNGAENGSDDAALSNGLDELSVAKGSKELDVLDGTFSELGLWEEEPEDGLATDVIDVREEGLLTATEAGRGDDAAGLSFRVKEGDAEEGDTIAGGPVT
jgi:hypothetical protein